jgi:hypothetical protein
MLCSAAVLSYVEWYALNCTVVLIVLFLFALYTARLQAILDWLSLSCELINDNVLVVMIKTQ